MVQMLAMLFKKKRHLLNSHILHLTFSLVGTLDSGRETSSIPHKAAFENLLCDLEVNAAAAAAACMSTQQLRLPVFCGWLDSLTMCGVKKLAYIVSDAL